MTSALSRPFDRFMVGMFLEMFHTLCQPLLLQLACASPSSLESYFVPILDDTPSCIPCLRCILGFEFNMFHPSTSIVVVRKQEVVLLHVSRGCPLLPPSCSLPAHLASGGLIWRNTRHGRSFRTLQFLSCVLNDVLVIGVLWRNVADTSLLTCSIQSTLSSSCFPSLWCAELWPVFHSPMLRPFG